jgi:hypothetical protein
MAAKIPNGHIYLLTYPKDLEIKLFQSIFVPNTFISYINEQTNNAY